MLVILVVVLAYHAMLLVLGLWAGRRTSDAGDYFLAGRGLGPWVASLSASASSSSGWTLLGVSGAAYVWGASALWLLPACLGGFALNWFLVAPRIRAESERTGALSVTELLADGSDGVWARRVRRCASGITLLCLGGYVASQFKASGTALAEAFEIAPGWGVLIGGGVVLGYTLMGGFLAVSLTDFVQGLVMAAAAVVVPLAAVLAVGGMNGLADAMGSWPSDMRSPWAKPGAPSILGFVVGTLGIGLGYPGQPHVVNRFMACRDESAVARGRVVAMTWAALVYPGMILAGWCGRILQPGLADPEGVLIEVAGKALPPLAAGLVIAAVMSAILSTADSQLLVCGGAVSNDLGGTDTGQGLRRGRHAVCVVGCLAVLAAWTVDQSVFAFVLLHWSGLGAAFGPLLLVRLTRGPVSGPWALAAMLTGIGVTVVWHWTPMLAGAVYELVPAFLAALVPAWIGGGRGGAGGTSDA